MKFTELELHPQVQRSLEAVQFVDCTPIQESAIPHILAGRDIAGLAQTGTGKTAAFLLPLIDRILRSQELADRQKGAGHPLEAEESSEVPVGAESTEPSEAPSGEMPTLRYFPNWTRRNYILILVPTRELAEQVYDNVIKLTQGTSLRAVSVYGGTTYDKQKAAFRDGVEFVIATPGRLIDLYKEHIADLRQVRAVVFDEADRMFDMGFKDDMKFILRRIPRERQFLVFSATLNFDVLNVAYEFGAFPVEINISKDQPKAENVQDEIFHVGQNDKPLFLISLLKKHQPKQAIIFSNFKRNVERITQFLNDNGIAAVGISSLLTQAQRNRVMGQFKGEGNQNILVATDLAARGLDILGVDLVINFELPDDPENYVHRIGRTGRAGQKGHAYSLVSDRDVDALARIEEYVDHKLETGWIEDSDLIRDLKPFPRDSESRFERRPQARPTGRDGHRGRDRDHNRDRNRDRDRGSDRGGRRPDRSGRRHEGRQQPARQQEHRNESRRSDQGPNPRPPRRQEEMGRHHQQGRRRHEGGPRRRHDQPRHHQGRPGSRPLHQRPMAAAASNASLGQKVSGFLKKLFGKES